MPDPVARGPDEYRDQLLALRPRGRVWPRDPDTVQVRIASGVGATVARLAARARALLADAFPAGATELLPEWESTLGLPDECGPVPDLIAARRALVVAKLVQRSSPTPAAFIALASGYGAAVTITQHTPYTCEMDCETSIYDEAWAYAWTINGPLSVIWEQTCEDHCEAPLRAWQTGPYECAIRRAAPAHTVPIFTYGA